MIYPIPGLEKASQRPRQVKAYTMYLQLPGLRNDAHTVLVVGYNIFV